VLDIKLIREKPDFVRARLATRHAGDEQKLDRLLAIDQEWRRALAELESAQAQRKKLAREIGELLTKEQGRAAEQLKEQTKALKTKIDELEAKVRTLEAERKSLLLQIPNLPHESVPMGRDASENRVVREFGTKPQFNFQPKTHVELCRKTRTNRFRTRYKDLRQRIYSFYRLRSEVRTCPYPIHARSPHFKTRIQGNLPSLFSGSPLHGRGRPISKIR